VKHEIGPEANGRRFRVLILVSGGVGGFVTAGAYALLSYTLDASSSDVFIPAWLVTVVLALSAGVVGLVGAVVALVVRRWMAGYGLAAWAQTIGIAVSTFLVGTLGYLAFAGWWGSGYGFFLAGALVAVPISAVAVVGMTLFPVPLPARGRPSRTR